MEHLPSSRGNEVPLIAEDLLNKMIDMLTRNRAHRHLGPRGLAPTSLTPFTCHRLPWAPSSLRSPAACLPRSVFVNSCEWESF